MHDRHSDEDLPATQSNGIARPWAVLRTVGALLVALLLTLASVDAPAAPTAAPPTAVAAGGDTAAPTLGAGDSIAVQVFGQPDMSGTVTVDDNGNISLPLLGNVKVAGLSPTQAADSIAQALVAGQYLVNPRVTMNVIQFRGMRVSVNGSVRTPNRYSIDSRTSILDLLAQAGGLTEDAGRIAYIDHPDGAGHVTRTTINLDDPTQSASAAPLHGGDSVVVPRASRFFIEGAVTAPNEYRLEPGMTVLQAIARAGGPTPRGSDRRVDIRRKDANGRLLTLHAHPEDVVQPDDVIHVKERIF